VVLLNAFIAKFLGSDLSLVWSTYFGGDNSDVANSVAVDGSGNVFVVGATASLAGFPLPNPPDERAHFDNTHKGGFFDAFIAKFLGSDLRLVWSTYFGGNGRDEAISVAVDGSGDVFVVGVTGSSSDFPWKDPGGEAHYDRTLDGDYEAFIAKFLGSDLSLVWSTYFGGNGRDEARSVAVDGSGDVFVVGLTGSSSDFPWKDPGGGRIMS
jgi:hypothetical protein